MDAAKKSISLSITLFNKNEFKDTICCCHNFIFKIECIFFLTKSFKKNDAQCAQHYSCRRQWLQIVEKETRKWLFVQSVFELSLLLVSDISLHSVPVVHWPVPCGAGGGTQRRAPPLENQLQTLSRVLHQRPEDQDHFLQFHHSYWCDLKHLDQRRS